MNVFEKKQASKITLDDTVPLTAVIEAAQKQDDHIVSSRCLEMGKRRNPDFYYFLFVILIADFRCTSAVPFSFTFTFAKY